MPVHLEPLDVFAELGECRSVLIVSCPVCPPVSLALQEDSRLIEFFRRGIKTEAFEGYIRSLRAELKRRNVAGSAATSFSITSANALTDPFAATSAQRVPLRI